MITRERDSSYNVRIFFLSIISFILIGLISVRLFVLQVVSSDYYSKLSRNQHQLSEELTPRRGEIFITDRYSEIPYPVVVNVNEPILSVNPQQISDAPSVAKILAPYLNMDVRVVLQKLTDTSRKYVIVSKQVPETVAEEIKTMELQGIYFEDQIHQTYPEGRLASQVLGFVAFDEDKRSGRYGIERYFEEDLAGVPGFLQTESGLRLGIAVSSDGEEKVVPARNGTDLILTIDRAIQFKAEEVLSRTVETHGAKSGSVIVLNPKTGAVLAMANYPTFDPNQFNTEEDPSVFNNPAVQISYEPGSVMKPITLAGALEEEVITPDMTFTDPGYVTLEKFTIRNADHKTYGEVTMKEVLEESINTGVIFAEQQLGHDKFEEYLENFGFGKPTGINLPFEDEGNISNLYRGGDLYPATIAYGQGMMATPLQIVSSYAAIANGGKLYRPYVVAEIVTGDGEKIKTDPELITEVISSRAASTLGAMMVSVVEKGHGKRAGVPGYFIGGKTGTAQVAYEDRVGYDPNRSIGTFAGFGPIDDPVFAMIVKIDEPQTVRFAESTAAPAFGEIAQFILNYYQVPVSRE